MNPSQQVDRLIRKLEPPGRSLGRGEAGPAWLTHDCQSLQGGSGHRPRRRLHRRSVASSLKGMVFRYLVLTMAVCQIMGFYIPGDIPDLFSPTSRPWTTASPPWVPTIVAFTPHQSLNELNARYPTIASCLCGGTPSSTPWMFRLWMVSLGQKSAHERLAHLLCELLVRFKAVGLAEDEHTCAFPMTQAELGGALGLTTVHVKNLNRVIQETRRIWPDHPVKVPAH